MRVFSSRNDVSVPQLVIVYIRKEGSGVCSIAGVYCLSVVVCVGDGRGSTCGLAERLVNLVKGGGLQVWVSDVLMVLYGQWLWTC